MNKLRFACLMGTAFEFFEFQIFALLLPFLTVHFFNPKIQFFNQYLEGYLTFGVAFLARPLGGLLLGHIGDHYGRREALLIAMWLMAISTMMIGLLPGYTRIGVAACILLLLCRIVQGLSLGGEFTSGSVFLFENQTKAKCIDLIWQDLGGTIGLFSATVIVMLTTMTFSSAEMQAFAWRFPFLAAVLLSLCGIYVRTSLHHPKPHAALIQQNRSRTIKSYYAQVCKDWPSLLLLTFACAPNGIFWYLHVIFIPNQLHPLNPSSMLVLISLTLIMIPVGAKLADIFGAYRVWIFSVAGLVFNFVLLILSPNSITQLIGITLQALLLAINQGPRFLILNNHFPLPVRAISCSLVYSMANVLGGMAPFVALWLLKHSENTQSLYQVLLVLCMLAVLSMLVLKTEFTQRKNLHGLAIEPD